MIAEKAFNELFPEKLEKFYFHLKYSGHFKGFNANVRRVANKITFSLSCNWRAVNEDIKIGLLQSLLCRLFKSRKRNINIDLYNNFLRSVHISIPKTECHPVLSASFDSVNNMFFDGLIEITNLVIGKGISKLGHYDYGTDTISISELLLNHPDLLDYVMYHEMLHKKHKFDCVSGRTIHHSRIFRVDEKKFPNAEQFEKRLSFLVSKNNVKRKLFSWVCDHNLFK